MPGEAKLTPFERITQAVNAQIPLVRAMEAELGREADDSGVAGDEREKEDCGEKQ